MSASAASANANAKTSTNSITAAILSKTKAVGLAGAGANRECNESVSLPSKPAPRGERRETAKASASLPETADTTLGDLLALALKQP